MQNVIEGDKRVSIQHSLPYTTPYQTVHPNLYRSYSNQQNSLKSTKPIGRYYTFHVPNKHFTRPKNTLNCKSINEVVFNENNSTNSTKSNLLMHNEKLKKLPRTYRWDRRPMQSHRYQEYEAYQNWNGCFIT